MTRHFLNLSDAGADALAAMITDAIDRKAARKGLLKGQPDADAPLAGHTLPPPPLGAKAQPDTEKLLELDPLAAPPRSVELRKRSEEREDDAFDLPPE